jgi:hypothetical protein
MIRFRVARSLLAAATISVAGLPGCEREEVTNARSVRASLEQHAGSGSAEGYAALEKAALDAKNATEPAQIDASAALAQATYAKAQVLFPTISGNEAAAHRLIAEMTALGHDVAVDNLLIETYKSADPAGAAAEGLKAFEGVLADLQGQAKKLDEQIKGLSDRKSALEGEIKTFEGQVEEKTKQANALLTQSEQAQGQQSLDLYRQSLEVRAEAGKLQDQLRIRQADLARLVSVKRGQETVVGEIEAAQNTRAVIEESIKAAQAQMEEIKRGWTETRAKIEERNKASRAVLETKSEEVQGLEARAEAFDKAVKTAGEAREACVGENGLLTKAIEAYKAAASTANVFTSQTLRPHTNDATSPSYQAYARMKQTYAPQHFELAAARVQYFRGILHAQHGELLEAQLGLVNALAPTLQKAGLAVPQQLGDASRLKSEIERVKKLADADLKALAPDLTGGQGDEDDKSDLQALAGRDDLESVTGSRAMGTEARALFAAAHYGRFHVTGDEKHRAMAESIVQGLDKDAMAEVEGGRIPPGLTYPLLPGDIKRALPTASISLPAAGTGRSATGTDGTSVEAGTPTRSSGTPGSWRGILGRASGALTGEGQSPPADNNNQQPPPGNQ